MNAPKPNPLIYGHFERLVPISVLGEVFDVPEGIRLIRAFQYIQFELGRMTCDWSLFCFNDTIGCCAFEFSASVPAEAGGAGGATPGRACCVRVVEGLRVAALPQGCHLLSELGERLTATQPPTPFSPEPLTRLAED